MAPVISWSAPVVKPIPGGGFLGFPSEVLFLVYIISTLAALLGLAWKLIFNSETKKLNDLMAKVDLVLTKVTTMETKVTHLENDKVTEAEVKDVARKEVMEFYSMIERMRKTQ